jgi:uncharacterized protein YkwD
MWNAVGKTLVVTAILACLSVPAPATAAVRVTAEDSLETAVLARVNSVRKAKGLRVLAIRTALKRAATDHVTNMARHGYFSHDWSTGAHFDRWIRRYWPGEGFKGSWSVGENLFWSSPAARAREVVRTWMASPPHRKNVLDKTWRGIGVGAVTTLDPIGAYEGGATATIVATEFGRRAR